MAPSGELVCYKLAFTTDRGERRLYFGTTHLGARSKRDACLTRERYHLERTLDWLSTAVAKTFQTTALLALQEKSALAQEALYTAVALAGNDEAAARGACWSQPRLSPTLKQLAAEVRKKVRGLSGQLARKALLDFAAELPKKSPLREHLEGKPFSGAKKRRRKLPESFTRSSRGKSIPGNLNRKRARARGELLLGTA